MQQSLLNPNAGGNPVKEDFYTLYMAFYDLIIHENKMPFDYKGIKNALFNIHSKLVRSRNYTTTSDREKNIDVCKGLIQRFFKKSTDNFRKSTSFVIDFKAYLMRSRTESALYDFKQGFYTLNPKQRDFSTEFFNKILVSLTALANLGKNKTGYLFIGVTDNEKDTLQVEKLDNLSDIPRVNSFGIVGLEREAKLKGVSLDTYIAHITKLINSSNLDESLKTNITKEITPITYGENTVLMIPVKNGDEPVYLNDVLYERVGAQTCEVKGAKQKEIFKLFN